jgi:hypothetical protein
MNKPNSKIERMRIVSQIKASTYPQRCAKTSFLLKRHLSDFTVPNDKFLQSRIPLFFVLGDSKELIV